MSGRRCRTGWASGIAVVKWCPARLTLADSEHLAHVWRLRDTRVLCAQKQFIRLKLQRGGAFQVTTIETWLVRAHFTATTLLASIHFTSILIALKRHACIANAACAISSLLFGDRCLNGLLSCVGLRAATIAVTDLWESLCTPCLHATRQLVHVCVTL